MSLIAELSNIIKDAERMCAELKESRGGRMAETVFISGETSEKAGSLVLGDNALIMAEGIFRGDLAGSCDMIYCDPPFFTKGKRTASIPVVSEAHPEIGRLKIDSYEDSCRITMKTYLTELTVRIMLMKEMLTDNGSIFMHLDMRAVHEVKLIMDEIFGEDNFINEIIWTYKSGGAAKRHLSRKHDNILYYSKNKDYCFNIIKEKSYNRGYKPYRFKGVEEFEDEIGWYTLVNQNDVWQINMVGRSSGERLNYATQKPEALLDRIINMSTDPGFRCADLYCGTGTLAASAAGLGRSFFCADSEPMALSNSMKRLLKAGVPFDVSVFSEKNNNTRITECFEKSIKAEISDGNCVLTVSTGNENVNNDKDVIGLLLRDDPVSLIDFWCAGTVKDGAFVSEQNVFRGKKGMLELQTSVISEITHVYIVDIFGGVYAERIEGNAYEY